MVNQDNKNISTASFFSELAQEASEMSTKLNTIKHNQLIHICQRLNTIESDISKIKSDILIIKKAVLK